MKKNIQPIVWTLMGLALLMYAFNNCGTPQLDGPRDQASQAVSGLFHPNVVVVAQAEGLQDLSPYVWAHFKLPDDQKIKMAPLVAPIVQVQNAFSRNGQQAFALDKLQIESQALGMIKLSFYLDGQAQTPNNLKSFYVVVVDKAQVRLKPSLNLQGPRYAMPGAVALYQLQRVAASAGGAAGGADAGGPAEPAAANGPGAAAQPAAAGEAADEVEGAPWPVLAVLTNRDQKIQHKQLSAAIYLNVAAEQLLAVEPPTHMVLALSSALQAEASEGGEGSEPVAAAGGDEGRVPEAAADPDDVHRGSATAVRLSAPLLPALTQLFTPLSFDASYVQNACRLQRQEAEKNLLFSWSCPPQHQGLDCAGGGGSGGSGAGGGSVSAVRHLGEGGEFKYSMLPVVQFTIEKCEAPAAGTPAASTPTAGTPTDGTLAAGTPTAGTTARPPAVDCSEASQSWHTLVSTKGRIDTAGGSILNHSQSFSQWSGKSYYFRLKASTYLQDKVLCSFSTAALSF